MDYEVEAVDGVVILKLNLCKLHGTVTGNIRIAIDEPAIAQSIGEDLIDYAFKAHKQIPSFKTDTCPEPSLFKGNSGKELIYCPNECGKTVITLDNGNAQCQICKMIYEPFDKVAEPGPSGLREDYPEDCDHKLKKKCYDVRNDCPHGTETAYQHCPLLGDCPYTKGDV